MTPTTKTDKGADCQYLQAVIKCNRMEKIINFILQRKLNYFLEL